MFMERVQSKCGKASEEWSKATDEHGKRLRIHQLEHLQLEHQPHPALATLLAKEWSDEAYEKIQAACRLFEEYCMVDTEAKAAQTNEGSNVPLKISDVDSLEIALQQVSHVSFARVSSQMHNLCTIRFM